MARDGSGVYTKLGPSVAVTATTIASNPYNLQIDDIASALNDVVLLNGLKPFTGDQSMGSHKLTNLTTGTAATDAANVGQIQSGISSHSATVGGTVDAITVTHVPVMTTWTAMTGFRGIFTATGANTSTTPTFNPDGIGAKTLVKWNNVALAPGDIIGAGHEVEWEYNGTNVVILNPGVILNSKGSAVASAGTTNIWATYDDFVHITGTTTITSLGTAPRAGAERTVIFDGALTLTHNATTLQLPGGANITTAAGDRAVVRADTTANMIVVSYIRAGANPLPAPGASGNVLTSNGTAWASSTPASSGAPVPQSGAGVGQWTGTQVFSGSYSLPAGGTWSYFYIVTNSGGSVSGSGQGVAAGGTSIVTPGGSNVAWAFHWRIA